MVVLTLREAIVQKERRAALAAGLKAGAQPVGQCGDEGLGLRVNFGQVVVGAGNVHRRTQVGGAVGPDQRVVLQRDTALMPDTAVVPALARQQFDRHGVEHLVADHDALDRPGQLADPLDLVAVSRQQRLLARAQRAGQVHDGVAAHPVAQGVEQSQRQRAGAGTEFPDLVGAGVRQRLADLRGQRLAEQRREFRRGDEIAALAFHARGHRAELGALVGVVAQARRVERQRHEAVEADPAARRGNGPRQQFL